MKLILDEDHAHVFFQNLILLGNFHDGCDHVLSQDTLLQNNGDGCDHDLALDVILLLGDDGQIHALFEDVFSCEIL